MKKIFQKLVKENNDKIYLDIETKLNDITKVVSVGYEKISVDVANKVLEIEKLLQKINPPDRGVKDIDLYTKKDLEKGEIPPKNMPK